MHACMYVCMRYTQSHIAFLYVCVVIHRLIVYVCMFVCAVIYRLTVYLCICMYVLLYADSVYACIYALFSVCMYVCMYV